MTEANLVDAAGSSGPFVVPSIAESAASLRRGKRPLGAKAPPLWLWVVVGAAALVLTVVLALMIAFSNMSPNEETGPHVPQPPVNEQPSFPPPGGVRDTSQIAPGPWPAAFA